METLIYHYNRPYTLLYVAMSRRTGRLYYVVRDRETDRVTYVPFCKFLSREWWYDVPAKMHNYAIKLQPIGA